MVKINKHILKAVNRGIKLALDDYQDNIKNSTTISKSDVIQNDIPTLQVINFWSDKVDLGLPSGTWWCKYNLGADPTSNSCTMWFGRYYAWGETQPKNSYRFLTYGLALDGTWSKLTKYTTNNAYANNGKSDGLTQLLSEDDAATVELGPHYTIPTKKQFEELLEYTTQEWVDRYKDIPFLNGKIFTSKINGNSIFIPAAGERTDKSTNATHFNIYKKCYLWTSTLFQDYNPHAYYFEFIHNKRNDIETTMRWRGMPIRPVYNR